MSVLGLDSGYTIKYNPLPSGVPLGFALGNSFRQRVEFYHISLVSFLYGYSIESSDCGFTQKISSQKGIPINQSFVYYTQRSEREIGRSPLFCQAGAKYCPLQ